MSSVKGIVPVSVELNGTLVARKVIVIAYTPEGEWDVVAHGVSSTLGPVGFEVTVPEGSLVYSAQVDDWGRVFEPDLIVSVGEVIRPTVFNGYTYEVMQDGQLPAMEPGWWTTPSTQQVGSAALARRVHTAPTIEGPVQGVEWESAGDPHWDNVVSLLNFQGSFDDDKGGLWERNSTTAVVLTDQGASFSGSTAWLRRTGLDVMGSEDFTLEGFCLPTQTALSTVVLGMTVTGRRISYEVRLSSTRLRFFYTRNNSTEYESVNYTLPSALSEVTHWAICREGVELRAYLGGVLVATGTISGALAGTPVYTYIGDRQGADNYGSFQGIISSQRITKGVARYTEDFTPPTEPFPNLK